MPDERWKKQTASTFLSFTEYVSESDVPEEFKEKFIAELNKKYGLTHSIQPAPSNEQVFSSLILNYNGANALEVSQGILGVPSDFHQISRQ